MHVGGCGRCEERGCEQRCVRGGRWKEGGGEGRKEGRKRGRARGPFAADGREARACVRAHTTTEACRQAPKRWVGKNSRERAEGRSRWVETHPVGRDACMRTPTDAYKAGAPTRPTPAGRAAPGRAPKKEFDSRHVFPLSASFLRRPLGACSAWLRGCGCGLYGEVWVGGGRGRGLAGGGNGPEAAARRAPGPPPGGLFIPLPRWALLARLRSRVHAPLDLKAAHMSFHLCSAGRSRSRTACWTGTSVQLAAGAAATAAAAVAARGRCAAGRAAAARAAWEATSSAAKPRRRAILLSSQPRGRPHAGRGILLSISRHSACPRFLSFFFNYNNADSPDDLRACDSSLDRICQSAPS